MGALDTTILRFSVGEVGIVREAVFGVNPGGGTYLETIGQLEVQALHRRVEPFQGLRGHPDPHHAHLVYPAGHIPAGSTVKTKHYVAGPSDAEWANAAAIASAAHATTGYPLSWILHAALGGKVYGGEGQLAAAVQAVGAIDLVDLDASLIDAGHGFVVNTSASATARWEGAFAKVATMGTEVITPRVVLANAPSATEQKKVWGTITHYTKATLEDSYTLTWLGWLESVSTPLSCYASGCVPNTLTFTLDPDGYLFVEVDWLVTGGDWDDADTAGSSYNAWNYATPEPMVSGRAVWAEGASVADLHYATCKIVVSNNLKTLPSPNAVRGKLTHKLGMREVTCECRIPYTAALRQAYVDQSALQVQIAHGTTPGRMTLFSLPQTHLASISGPVDQEEYAYCDATFRALRYVGDTEPAGGQGADNRLFSVAF